MANGVKTGGRRAGTPNKRSAELQERLAELNCDPLAALATVAKKAEEEGNLPLMADCYKSLMPYAYPKLKSVEIVNNQFSDYLDSLSDEELQKVALDTSRMISANGWALSDEQLSVIAAGEA